MIRSWLLKRKDSPTMPKRRSNRRMQGLVRRVIVLKQKLKKHWLIRNFSTNGLKWRKQLSGPHLVKTPLLDIIKLVVHTHGAVKVLHVVILRIVRNGLRPRVTLRGDSETAIIHQKDTKIHALVINTYHLNLIESMVIIFTWLDALIVICDQIRLYAPHVQVYELQLK